ncbi:unnamed protein product [Onchocerca flexuosa]|uniref:Dynein light chain n=1 Tax=Onchocerca flexuosa TaxID=387005 RepID=A0A183GYR5_9BILA|nr:unnamed protein product [Onchocerca flexuosa]
MEFYCRKAALVKQLLPVEIIFETLRSRHSDESLQMIHATLVKLNATGETYRIVYVAKREISSKHPFNIISQIVVLRKRLNGCKRAIKQHEASKMSYSIEMSQAKAAFAQKLVKQQIDLKNYNFQQVAKLLKQRFDNMYGIGWQCIIGNSFGCYITHLPDCFLYFSAEPFSVSLKSFYSKKFPPSFKEFFLNHTVSITNFLLCVVFTAPNQHTQSGIVTTIAKFEVIQFWLLLA